MGRKPNWGDMKQGAILNNYTIEVYSPHVIDYIKHSTIQAASPEAAIEKYRKWTNDRTRRVRVHVRNGEELCITVISDPEGGDL